MHDENFSKHHEIIPLTNSYSLTHDKPSRETVYAVPQNRVPGLKSLMRATSPQTEKISATDSIVGRSMGRLIANTVLEIAGKLIPL